MTTPAMNCVTATLFYLSLLAGGTKPYVKINTILSRPQRSWGTVGGRIPLRIENLRSTEDSVSLDATAFQYFHQVAAYITFDDGVAI